MRVDYATLFFNAIRSSDSNVKACNCLRPLGRPAARREADAAPVGVGGGGHTGCAFLLRNNYATCRVINGR